MRVNWFFFFLSLLSSLHLYIMYGIIQKTAWYDASKLCRILKVSLVFARWLLFATLYFYSLIPTLFKNRNVCTLLTAGPRYVSTSDCIDPTFVLVRHLARRILRWRCRWISLQLPPAPGHFNDESNWICEVQYPMYGAVLRVYPGDVGRMRVRIPVVPAAASESFLQK